MVYSIEIANATANIQRATTADFSVPVSEVLQFEAAQKWLAGKTVYWSVDITPYHEIVCGFGEKQVAVWLPKLQAIGILPSHVATQDVCEERELVIAYREGKIALKNAIVGKSYEALPHPEFGKVFIDLNAVNGGWFVRFYRTFGSNPDSYQFIPY